MKMSLALRISRIGFTLSVFPNLCFLMSLLEDKIQLSSAADCGHRVSSRGHSDKIKIMTWNILNKADDRQGANQYKYITETVKPAIVGLQEATHNHPLMQRLRKSGNYRFSGKNPKDKFGTCRLMWDERQVGHIDILESGDSLKDKTTPRTIRGYVLGYSERTATLVMNLWLDHLPGKKRALQRLTDIMDDHAAKLSREGKSVKNFVMLGDTNFNKRDVRGTDKHGRYNLHDYESFPLKRCAKELRLDPGNFKNKTLGERLGDFIWTSRSPVYTSKVATRMPDFPPPARLMSDHRPVVVVINTSSSHRSRGGGSMRSSSSGGAVRGHSASRGSRGMSSGGMGGRGMGGEPW